MVGALQRSGMATRFCKMAVSGIDTDPPLELMIVP